jgi:glycine/D-amino acid oxidase-like deaminating enzyme
MKVPPLVRTRGSVLVVGGGAIGLGAALACAEQGSAVCLVEADHIGAGSTTRCAGCRRDLHSSRANVRLAQYSTRVYRRLDSSSGGALQMRDDGYLWTHRRGEDLDATWENTATARAEGCRVERLTGNQVRSMFPYVDRKIAGAVWSPDDGTIDAAGLLGALRDECDARGVRFRTGARVVQLERERGRVVGAWAADGKLHRAEDVVVATGPWLRNLVPGVPVAPVRRLLYVTGPLPVDATPSFPMLIVDGGAYARRDGVRFWLGFDEAPRAPRGLGEVLAAPLLADAPDYVPPPGFGAREDYAAVVLRELGRACSIFAEQIGVAVALGGFYEVTPDLTAIVDEIEPGLWVAGGGSGHGVMMAAGIGAHLAAVLHSVPSPVGIEASALGVSLLLRNEARAGGERMTI